MLLAINNYFINLKKVSCIRLLENSVIFAFETETLVFTTDEKEASEDLLLKKEEFERIKKLLTMYAHVSQITPFFYVDSLKASEKGSVISS